ncbi:hypothetical protein Rwratislav_06300, partial [Rhodococcus wratislaviensis IFP 2016]
MDIESSKVARLLAPVGRQPLTWRAGPGDEVLAEDLLACPPRAADGAVVPVDLGMMVGEDAAVDVEAEPDRWLRFD